MPVVMLWCTRYPLESLDQHCWQLCVNTWLTGSTNKYSHRGRSRVGSGCREKPLICRKTTPPRKKTLPPESKCNHPPLRLTHPGVCECQHTLARSNPHLPFYTTFAIIIIIITLCYLLLISSSLFQLYLFSRGFLHSEKPSSKNPKKWDPEITGLSSGCNPVSAEATLRHSLDKSSSN